MEISKIALGALTGIGITTLVLTPIQNNIKMIKKKTPEQIFDIYTTLKFKEIMKIQFKDLSKNLKETASKELVFVIVTECFKHMIAKSNPLIQFGIGAISGLLETLVTYPNSYCKGLSKYGLTKAGSNSGIMKSSEKLFREIFVDEGFLGLYNGSTLFFLSNIIFNGVF